VGQFLTAFRKDPLWAARSDGGLVGEGHLISALQRHWHMASPSCGVENGSNTPPESSYFGTLADKHHTHKFNSTTLGTTKERLEGLGLNWVPCWISRELAETRNSWLSCA
jgi:hypothetical protein